MARQRSVAGWRSPRERALELTAERSSAQIRRASDAWRGPTRRLASAQATADGRRCAGMRRLVRENAVCVLAAAGASAAMAWLGLYGFTWTDYEIEAQPSFSALTHGHVLEFLRLAPAYGGSLVERAPFALLPGLWGGGELAVYRTVALPCLLAVAALAVWLCARMRGAGRPAVLARDRAGCLRGQPADPAGAGTGPSRGTAGRCPVCRRGAAGRRGRTVWAGVLLGLAIANKEWALIATGPVLLVLPGPVTSPDNSSGGVCVGGLASGGDRSSAWQAPALRPRPCSRR